MLLIPGLGKGCVMSLICFSSLFGGKLLVVSSEEWQEGCERFLNLPFLLRIYSLTHSDRRKYEAQELRRQCSRRNISANRWVLGRGEVWSAEGTRHTVGQLSPGLEKWEVKVMERSQNWKGWGLSQADLLTHVKTTLKAKRETSTQTNTAMRSLLPMIPQAVVVLSGSLN